MRFFIDVLGARLGFAIEGMGARVAMVVLANGPPHLLLADHLDGDRPILVYRVKNLGKATAELKKRGLKKQHEVELPMGPASSFVTKGGHRVALYELSRAGVLDHFTGRQDF
jgi:hypothetical protein